MADSDKGFADIMNITVISSLFVLILSFCYGQGERALDRHFNRFIDSLDNVRCVSLNSVKPQGRAFLIKIQNQNQFDRINEFIRAAIEDGWTNIIVRISRGTFHYHENHINLNGLKDSNVSITIKGNKTTVTSEKTVSNEGYTMNPWCVLYEADSLIEVIDKREKLCLAPCKGLIENGCESFYEKVQITQWFKAPV